MFLILQLGADGPDDLVRSHALGISGSTHIPVWSLALRSDTCGPSRKLSHGPLGEPVQAAGCVHHRGGCSLQPPHTRPHGEESLLP